MAVQFMAGFDSQDATLEQVTRSGTTSFDTSIFRSGTASLKCNPASGANGFCQYSGGDRATGANITPGFVHFALYVTTLPSLARRIFIGGAGPTIKLNSDGTLEFFDGATSRGTTSALSTATWYVVGARISTGTSVDLLQLNGVTAVTGNVTGPGAGTTWTFGPNASEASAIDINIDDIIYDGAAFVAPSKVAFLLPTADSARGTGWTTDSGGTTNFFQATDNTPPAGIADTTGSTGLHQIRNATSNANSNYDATLQTYSAAGVGASDTLLAVQNITATGAPVSTSAKQGTVGNVSNPAIANVALGAGGTSGAFWSGTAAGTYATGWKISAGTLTTSPSVTFGTAPVMRITQVTSSTRIAMVCFMALMIVWTPAAAAPMFRGIVNFQDPGVL